MLNGMEEMGNVGIEDPDLLVKLYYFYLNTL
jgi:hypothetical protein